MFIINSNALFPLDLLTYNIYYYYYYLLLFIIIMKCLTMEKITKMC